MKKLIYCVAALATALFASSCQQELLDTAGSSTVTYTVELPDVQTKAKTGDGLNVTHLIYEVWRTAKANDTELNESASGASEPRTERLYSAEATRQGDIFKFDVDLVQNQNYTILFWAHVVDATGVNAYYNTSDLRSVTLTTRALGAFDEDRAAFYGIDFIVANEPRKATQQVTLTRPFGQLNLGTTERNNPNYQLTVENTLVTVKGASTEFNVATGVASSTKTANLTFASDKPFTNEKLNGTYEWIAMNYIFVPANQATLEVDYTITTNHGSVTNTVGNVPTKKNYRTNILGNLLTSKTDYIVDINANWVADYNGNEDGEFAPAYNEETKTYEIATAQELTWVSEQAKAGNTFINKTLVLMNDIDLNGVDWTPIADFHGTFKGLASTKAATYPTISNFTVNVAECAGLFGDITGGKLSDFNVRNATITANHYAGAVVGFMHGSGSITNVHVQNSTISVTPILNASNKYDDGDKAGAIAGYFCADGTNATMRMENCSATDVDILAYRDLGGLVGCLNGTDAYVGNCNVTDVRVTADTDYDYASNSAINAGEVVGRIEGAATIGNDNVVTNVTVKIYKPIAESVQTEGANVNLLGNKTYTLPAEIADGITIVGSEGTVLNVPATGISANGITIKNVTLPGSIGFTAGTSAILENCVINRINAQEKNSLDLQFKNCTIGGSVAVQMDLLEGGKASFEGCVISGWNAFGGTGELTVSNCTFNYSPDYNQMRIYNLDKAEFTNCVFDQNYAIDIKGINGTKNVDVVFNKCTVTSAPEVRSTVAIKKFIELVDLEQLSKYKTASYVIDGTRVNYQTIIIKNATDLCNATSIGAGKTVILAADIDLTDTEFNGLSAFNSENNNTFDGMGCTVSNWTYTGRADDTGFFKSWVGTIKNLTVKNAVLRTGGRSAVIAANTFANIENCHVEDCNIQGNWWACGLIAGLYNSGNVSNCSAKNSYVKSTGGTGAIVGVANETAGVRSFSNCTVVGCTINDGGTDPYAGGAILGMVNIDNATVKFINCTQTGNTFMNNAKDAIYGYNCGDNTTVVIE